MLLRALVVLLLAFWSAAGAQAQNGFEIFTESDMPGFDLRTIRRIGLAECSALCLSETQCQAFTHNTAKNVCFLKSQASVAVPFAGAVSGFRDAAARITQPLQVPTASAVEFDILENADLPGGDYRDGLSDRRLRGLSLAGCSNLCAADARCSSFTLNLAKGICFLKETSPLPQGFVGAVSGRKQQGAAPAFAQQDTVSEALLWREERPEKDFVASIRNAAKPYGGKCGLDRASIEAAARAMTVSMTHPPLRSGDAVEFEWKGKTPEGRFPAYLVIFADTPVRVDGAGLYVLTPGARAPFGIEAERKKTRAVIPLTGPGARAQGKMRMQMLLAGPAQLGWTVLGFDRGCGRDVPGVPSFRNVNVAPGYPVISVDDAFSLSVPRQIVRSPDGDRQIRIFDDRFQLVETARMAVLGEYAGKQPAFSVTGRFITFVRSDVASSEDLDQPTGMPNIIDAVDGQMTGSSVDNPAAWSNDDSFVTDSGSYGRVTVLNPLLKAGEISAASMSCFACSGWSEVSVRIDLENNLTVNATQAQGSRALALVSLTAKTSLSNGMWGEEGLAEAEIIMKFETEMQMSALRIPERWEMEGGLQLSMPVIDPQFKDTPWGINQDRFALKPLMVESDGLAETADAETLTASTEWRGLAPASGNDAARLDFPGFIAKLEDFGFVFASPVQPQTLFDGKRPIPTSDAELQALRETFWTMDSRLRKGIYVRPNEYGGFDNCSKEMDEAIDREVFDVTDISAHGIWGAKGKRFGFVQITCQESARASSPWTEFYVIDATSPKGLRRETFEGAEFQLYDRGELVGINAADIQFANVDDFKKVQRAPVRTRNSLVLGFRMTGDRGHIVQMNNDGSFFVLRFSDGMQILEGRYIDDEIVVWTPDMHFDASIEGAHFVSLRFPGSPGQYTFQQFGNRLRVPGLIRQALAGSLPSDVILPGTPPRLTARINRTSGLRIGGEIAFEATTALREIQIYQDGLHTDTIIPPATGETGVLFDIARLSGARWLSIVAVDLGGLASLPVGLALADTGKLPVIRSLIVGVDRYTDPQVQSLAFAVADAETLSRSIATADGKSLVNQAPVVLKNGDASPEAILAAAEKLVAEAKPGETIAFFFAGHGLTGRDGGFYMATGDIRLERLEETALAWKKLASVLVKAKARVLVFLDACHSGVAGTDFFATNDAAVNALAGGPSGIVVLSASKGRQLSEESKAAGGGLFTNAVADVIARDRGRYDHNRNGAIEVSELYAGVKRLVMERSKGRQTPWLARNRMVGDFSLF